MTCIYCLVMISINLSKKLTPHVQSVTGSADVIVTQLLHYHMLLLYLIMYIWRTVNGQEESGLVNNEGSKLQLLTEYVAI